MLSQWFNQMEHHFSERPFRRPHWWSRRWVAHIRIRPPLTREAPLWKRTKDELRLLRLFNLSPEELGQKIERYWKKPRWRRWFASFGMNKKIDIWNYYQRCLAYQRVRQATPLIESSLVLADTSQRLLNELASTLQASTIKFESYLEKRCRNLSWVKQDFLTEVENHQERLRKDFSLTLQKRLMDLTTEEQALVREKAEKEYRHIEVLMYHYYQLWQWGAFYKRVRSEIGIEVAPVEKEANPERRLVVCPSTSSAATPNTATPGIMCQTGISSLYASKGWIQSRRKQLEDLIKENSMPLVKELLQGSFECIKNTIDPQLQCYETMLVSLIVGDSEQEAALQFLDRLQSQLKPLLQGGFYLFNTDHVMYLIQSKEIFQLITQYSQAYLQQNRLYLERLQGYQQRLKRRDEQRLQAQAQSQTLSELSVRIDKLYQSCQEMYARFTQDYTEMYARFEAQRARDYAAQEARFEAKFSDQAAKHAQDFAEMQAKLDKLLAHSTQQQESSFDSYTPENSTHFFTRPSC